MKEEIKILRTFLEDRMAVYNEDLDICLKNVLNELERLKTENSNITRELLARTNKLNELLEENYKLNRKIIRYTRYLEIKDKKLEELLEYEYAEREQDYMPKQVIRNKIEELEEEKLCFYSDYAIEERNNKIQVLKELLGEEK